MDSHFQNIEPANVNANRDFRVFAARLKGAR